MSKHQIDYLVSIAESTFIFEGSRNSRYNISTYIEPSLVIIILLVISLDFKRIYQQKF